jgi:hypothetical protein
VVLFDELQRAARTGLDAVAAGDALERLKLTFDPKHCVDWTKTNAHVAGHAQIFLQEDNSGACSPQRSGGANRNTLAALIAKRQHGLSLCILSGPNGRIFRLCFFVNDFGASQLAHFGQRAQASVGYQLLHSPSRIRENAIQ